MTADLNKPQQEINNVISSVSCKISIRQTGSSRLSRRGEGGPVAGVNDANSHTIIAIISTNYPAQATLGS